MYLPILYILIVLISSVPLGLFKFTCKDILIILMDYRHDIDDAKTKTKYFKHIAQYFYLNRQSKSHSYVGFWFLLSSILCLIFTLLLCFVCAIFFDGQLLNFFHQFVNQLFNHNNSLVKNPVYTVFPELGKCNVPQIDLLGNTYFLDALCNLNYNMIHKQWFIVFCTFLVIMIIVSSISLLAHFTLLVSLKSRCYCILKLSDSKFKNNFLSPISGTIIKDNEVFLVFHKRLIRRVISKLSFGDFIVLYFIIGTLTFSDSTSLLTVLDETLLSHINIE